MARADWKRCGAGLGIWVGLTAAMFACSGSSDVSSAPDSGGPGDDAQSGQDASADARSTKDVMTKDVFTGDVLTKDAPEKDSADHDSRADAMMTGEDATADVTVQPPKPLNLCTTFDGFWNGETRSDATAWPALIVNGPPSPDPDQGLIGYENVGDCTVGTVFATAFDPSEATAWTNQLIPFTYRFFGCADDSQDAGTGFALVPPNLYGQPFGPDDLKKLGDWYVQSVIQAIANQSANNASAMLTGDQIDQIQAEIDYQETLYPNILPGAGYHYSTCVDAGTSDAGGD